MKKFMILFILISLSACTFIKDKNQKKSEVQIKEHDNSSEAVQMIANDEKIIEMLKKTGEIPENATQEEIQKAFQKYLKKKAPGNLMDEKEKQKYIKELKEKIQKNKGN